MVNALCKSSVEWRAMCSGRIAERRRGFIMSMRIWSGKVYL